MMRANANTPSAFAKTASWTSVIIVTCSTYNSKYQSKKSHRRTPVVWTSKVKKIIGFAKCMHHVDEMLGRGRTTVAKAFERRGRGEAASIGKIMPVFRLEGFLVVEIGILR